jgi:hypothetical protein
MTDSTVISTIIPSAMQITDTSETNEMNWLRRRARVYRIPMKVSYDKR